MNSTSCAGEKNSEAYNCHFATGEADPDLRSFVVLAKLRLRECSDVVPHLLPGCYGKFHQPLMKEGRGGREEGEGERKGGREEGEGGRKGREGGRGGREEGEGGRKGREGGRGGREEGEGGRKGREGGRGGREERREGGKEGEREGGSE